MEHFPEHTWADFVRGISEAGIKTDVESHLARGCSSCKVANETWGRVHATVSSEKMYTPPESVVRMLKQEFEIRYPLEQRPSFLATLAFDTFAQPMPTGVRSAAATAVARQLVFEAEGVTIDLRVNFQLPKGSICLVGQVLQRGSSLDSPGNATIILLTEKGYPLMEVTANHSGEFQLEFELQNDLRLSVDLPGRKTIRIPLVNLGPAIALGDITLGTEEDYS